VSAAALYLASVSESISPADALSALGNYLAALAESVAPTDSLTADGTVWDVSITETASAADTLSAAALYLASVSESVSPVDTLAAAAAYLATLAESTPVADTLTAAAAFLADLAEAASATDALSAVGEWQVSITEDTALTDSIAIPSNAVDPRYIIFRSAGRLYTLYRSRSFLASRQPRTFEVTSMAFQFPTKGVLEAVPLTFDFSSDLASGETLAGAISVNYVTVSGPDPNPAALANGSAAFDPTGTMVVLPVHGGVADCTYRITVTSGTSNPSKTLSMVGMLPVRNDPD
jgi:hypothetical protein